MFEIVEEKVREVPTEALVGVAVEAVRSAAFVVTSTHGPQLLFSSDSDITPLLAELVLSAQALTEYVPGELNVYEGEVVVLFAPAAKAVIDEEVRSVIV